MNNTVLLLSLLISPLALAPLILLFKNGLRELKILFGIVCIVSAIGLHVIYKTLVGGPLNGCSNWLNFDALSAFMLVILLLVYLLSSLFAITYFGKDEFRKLSVRNVTHFCILWLGSMSALMTVLAANNIVLMWVGVEASTVLTAFFISLYQTKFSIEAMWKYLILCSIGVAFALIGTMLIGASATGSPYTPDEILFWTNLKDVAHELNVVYLSIAFVFIFVGYGTKGGIAPMHTWLPDAYEKAPSPVAAFFSGFLTNIGIYCIMRFIPVFNFIALDNNIHIMLEIGGIVSLILATAFIIFQKNIKRLLAYCSVEHLGIIVLGLALGGIGTFAALLHTFNHSIAKVLAFVCAGRIGRHYGTHKIAEIQNTIKTMPLIGFGNLVAFACLIGVAPLAIFISEFKFYQAIIYSGHWHLLIISAIAMAIIFMVMLKVALNMTFGRSLDIPVYKSSKIDRVIVISTIAILLSLGLYLPSDFIQFIKEAAAIIEG